MIAVAAFRIWRRRVSTRASARASRETAAGLTLDSIARIERPFNEWLFNRASDNEDNDNTDTARPGQED